MKSDHFSFKNLEHDNIPNSSSINQLMEKVGENSDVLTKFSLRAYGILSSIS